jgi:hypothetical protein
MKQNKIKAMRNKKQRFDSKRECRVNLQNMVKNKETKRMNKKHKNHMKRAGKLNLIDPYMTKQTNKKSKSFFLFLFCALCCKTLTQLCLTKLLFE